MDARQRTWLILLAAVSLIAVTLSWMASTQNSPQRAIDIQIEKRKVISLIEQIQATKGERIQLRWTSDEPVKLHLRGYALEIDVRPGESATMTVEAYATGRFPITIQGSAGGVRGRDVLIYLEVRLPGSHVQKPRN